LETFHERVRIAGALEDRLKAGLEPGALVAKRGRWDPLQEARVGLALGGVLSVALVV
jgi:hypothetical protein